MKKFCLMDWIEKKLKLNQSEEKVEKIKQHVQHKIDETNITLKKQGKLQTKVMHKTTTYYIGRAAGTVK